MRHVLPSDQLIVGTMKRYPLALPVVITLATSWLCADVPIRFPVLASSAVMLALAGCLSLRLQRYAASLLLFSLCCGMLSGAQVRRMLGRHPSGHEANCQRRITSRMVADGTVTQLVSSGNRTRVYVVYGELDASCAPCVRGRYLVRESGPPGGNSLAIGQRRVITGEVRRPLAATLDGEFSEIAYARSLGCALVVERARSVDVGPAPLLTMCVERARDWVRRRLAQACNEQTSAIAIALLIGDRSYLDAESRTAYRLSGTAHIFSVSGSHVAIITWLVMMLVGRRPGPIALCIGALIIAAYTLLAGAEPPAVRSAIMGIAAMVGVRRERDANGLNLLLLSVLLIIVLDPLSSTSGGFFLSCTATLALVVLAPRCRAAIDRCIVHRTSWKSIVADGISVSWAATLGVTLPTALAFGSISFLAPLANLVVVPLMSGAMLMAMGVALSPAAVITKALSWWLTLLVWCADAISRTFAIDVLPGEGSARVTLVAMVYSLVLAWPLVARSWLSLLVRIAAGGIALAILIGVARFGPGRGPGLHVIERRFGVVINRSVVGELQIIVVGERHAQVDVSLVRWARSKHPRVVVGLGLWGRRMKGAILHPPRDSIRR